MDDKRMAALEEYAELDDVAPDGVLCVGLTDEDMAFFEKHTQERMAKKREAQTQQKVDRMYSGDVSAIIAGIHSGNDYLMMNAVLSGAKHKIKDTSFMDGLKKAQESEAVLLGFSLKSVAEAAYIFLTGREYTGEDAGIKTLIESEFQ